MHYFDYAATTPLHNEAAEVYVAIAQQYFGNTTSLHDEGGMAQNILTQCRQRLGELLDVHPAGLYFTSGGTESNSLALLSLAYSARSKGNHIIITAAEHPSIHSAAAYLNERGFRITTVSFTPEGMIDLEELEAAITEDTIVVSVQHCNPEIGTIQPIRAVFDLVKQRDILVHSDCVQSFGKLHIRQITPYVDSLSVSSHKLYGPKGVGAVYINPRIRAVPLFPGVVQERGFRGGTVNVPAIAAFIRAAELAEVANEYETYQSLRTLLLEKLQSKKQHFTIYGTDKFQLPHIIGFCVNGSEGQLLMLELNRRGFAVSTGSACQVGQQQSSTTMTAMKISPTVAKGLVRISFGHTSTVENTMLLADALLDIAQTLHTRNEKAVIQ
ncbi:aminotransferase class V-fold PLP-dependent enzyme [Sporosarcina sp. PTS2304]|uniref:IscS subfamily cysteine desulfurase n=1 Tax=Sporosarcina sp. PTS2304 TaxID=2283194 RepID=UPI000E0CD22C|nr:IscS subfamily cysteine desulfurase [Sporosarcina sp. PTS2304]AXH98923.1 aminotransferase class V-fold PLP-dependent enzyme [Sporosarcina sp. PTS2304]